VRPLRIDTIALTNDPNLKGLTPISNRARSAATTTQNKTMDHKTVLTQILGVAATATDAEIQTAADTELAADSLANRLAASTAEVTELKNRATDLEKAVNDLTVELVESDLKTYAGVIHDPAAIKTQLIANRAATVAVLKGIKQATAPAASATTRAPLYNRNTLAVSPEVKASADKNQANAILNRANGLVRLKSMPFRQAWELAKSELNVA
jgi:phage I-like protein